MQRHRDAVAGRGQRPLTHPDCTDVQGGVTVGGEGHVDPLHGTSVNRFLGPTGNDFLGRLEDPAHGQARLDELVLALFEGDDRPEQGHGMDVMTAGVAHPGDLEARQEPARSRTGRASMSARSATR